MCYPVKVSIDAAAFYKISVFGFLNEGWSDNMSGMTIATREDKEGVQETILTGELVDQAALLGVLNALYNLGYVLCSVERQRDKPFTISKK